MNATNEVAEFAHLVRRFVSSLSRREPDTTDTVWAESQLLAGELNLWRRLTAA